MPERTNISDLLNIAGARIWELRQAKGLSQEELGDRAGCHRTYVGIIEGIPNPPDTPTEEGEGEGEADALCH